MGVELFGPRPLPDDGVTPAVRNRARTRALPDTAALPAKPPRGCSP